MKIKIVRNVTILVCHALQQQSQIVQNVNQIFSNIIEVVYFVMTLNSQKLKQIA